MHPEEQTISEFDANKLVGIKARLEKGLIESRHSECRARSRSAAELVQQQALPPEMERSRQSPQHVTGEKKE